MSRKNIKYLLDGLAALSASSGALVSASEQQYQQLSPGAYYPQMVQYPQQMVQQYQQWPQGVYYQNQMAQQYPRTVGQIR